MDYQTENRLSVLPQAYAPFLEVDQGTNLVPSLQPDAAAELGPAYACLYPKCGHAFHNVADLEGHMTTHDFHSLINQGHGPASTPNGFTWDLTFTHNTLTDNINTNNTLPIANPSLFANPANLFNPIAGASNPSVGPAPQSLGTGTATITPARYHCPHSTCTSTFKRPSDLHRHAKIHQPSARKYECFVPGCLYRGGRGFLRRDKLLSHQRNAHGLRY